MSNKSKIEWTDVTWNPVTGCSKVSDGCKNCYAERMTARFRKDHKPWTVANAAHNVVLRPDRLDDPLHWKKPRRVFVNSMSDLFHEQVSNDFIHVVFDRMVMAPQHIFQLLTKRPQRMLEIMQQYERIFGVADMRHIWLGVSVENQKTADERIPLLLQTPAAVRFLSCEPLLDEVDLSVYLWRGNAQSLVVDGRLHWCIVGGESGPGARPMHPDWARSLRDQCAAAGVTFFFKQWGEWFPRDQWEHNPDLVLPDDCDAYVESATTQVFEDSVAVHRVGKVKAGRLLDGCTWNEYPQVVTA